MHRVIVLFLTILSVTCEQTSDVKGFACEDLAKEMQALKEAFAQFQQNEELQNATIEERVTLLETQMEIVNGAIADIEDDIDNLEGQVTVLFGDQVIQDEQLLELGTATENLEVISEQLSVSVAELQAGQSQINSTVLGIDATVIEIDERVIKMEQNGTVAFNADLGEYTSIPLDSVVVFQQVNLNIGDGYDSTTGQFTVPPGGDGLYYFYAHFRVVNPKFAQFFMRRNGGVFCVVWEDERNGNDSPASSCGAVVTLVEGDVVEVFYDNGTDDVPVVSNNNPFSSFTGVRIAPL